MRIRSLVGMFVSALLLLPASTARADRLVLAGVRTDMGAGAGTSLGNTISGLGLNPVTLTALHESTTIFNSWVSGNGILVGQVTFNLGGSFAVKGFSFWNQNGGGPGAGGSTGIQGVNVLFSTDGLTFLPLPGAPSAFARVPGAMAVGPQTFSFAPVVATYVRFQILSNYGDALQTGFAEVGFDVVETTAAYDALLKAPRCATLTGSCDSGGLLLGRGFLFGGAEPNEPNTINNSCVDGPAGTFHADESIDRLRVSTVDGGLFAAGKMVRVTATVWAFASFSDDHLDLYYTSHAANPTWTYLTTLTPAGAGAQTLSATYVLPAGGLQAVRAAFRYQQAPSTCTTGDFDDRDDLVFAVSNSIGDFDGDGKADVTVFRAATGGWYTLNSSTGYTTSVAHFWGLSTDTPVTGDFDGDGKTDPTIYRPSTGLWAILMSSTNYTTSRTVSWGLSTDVPVPADFDGDGKADPTIYRPSSGLWAILKSSTNYATSTTLSWGAGTDVPVPGDYDGDGKADPAFYRASTGLWSAVLSSTSYATSLALVVDDGVLVAVPGDYDGDGKIDPVVYRPAFGNWLGLKSSTNYTTFLVFSWGLPADVAAPADYDGDGKTDPAIFRPSTGLWAILKSSTNYTTSFVVSWGLSTDTPINKRP